MIEVAAGLGLLAVADGVGGAAAGNEASQRMIDHLVQHCVIPADSVEHPSRGLRAEILDAIEEANREILGWASGAGTTLTAVQFFDGHLRTFHVGDSSAMLVSNHGKIKFATVGHAPVAQAVDIGLLDEDEALAHEDRNLISNCLGSAEMKIEIGPPIAMAARDTLVVASDGLYDNLTREEIADAIRKGDLTEQTDMLAQCTGGRMKGSDSKEPSKPDDLTIICFRMN